MDNKQNYFNEANNKQEFLSEFKKLCRKYSIGIMFSVDHNKETCILKVSKIDQEKYKNALESYLRGLQERLNKEEELFQRFNSKL